MDASAGSAGAVAEAVVHVLGYLGIVHPLHVFILSLWLSALQSQLSKELCAREAGLTRREPNLSRDSVFAETFKHGEAVRSDESI